MRPYPSYEDSGVEWIGEIPSGWEVKRLKYFYDVFSSSVDRHIYEDELHVSVCHYPDVYNNEFINKDIELNKGSCSKVEFDRFHLKEGLVILTKDSESPDDIGIPCYVETNLKNVVCGYHLSIIEKKEDYINSKFLFRFIQSDLVRCHFEVHSNGITRFGLGKSIIENLFVNLPPLPEQKQIVSFLDYKTQKIDELIEKTEKKIELLKEKRTSLINHYVTKGLNPNVEIKDSGVEWIGEIPSEWGFPKVRYITSIEYGNSLKEEDRIDGEYNVYGSNGVVGTHHNSLTNGETIIIGRKGSYGKINLSQNPCYPIDTTFFIGKKNTKHDIKWMFYGLSVLRLDSFTKDSSVPGINREEIYERYLPLPPLSEQHQIVEYLDEQTQKIDSTIKKETKRIELLKEYRQSLISEVVTGKIDVRDWKN